MGYNKVTFSRNALLLSKLQVYDLSHKRPQHKPSHFNQSVSTPVFLLAYFNIILISSPQSHLKNVILPVPNCNKNVSLIGQLELRIS